MCLAVPARVAAKNGDDAWVSLGDTRVRVNLSLTPEAGIGDWVLVHAGFAIQQLDEQTAMETWSMLRELSETKEDPCADEQVTIEIMTKDVRS